MSSFGPLGGIGRAPRYPRALPGPGRTCTASRRRSHGHLLTARRKPARSSIDAALLVLRLTLGVLILIHGLSKLPPPPAFIVGAGDQGGLARRARLRRLHRRDRRADPAHRRRLDARSAALLIVANMVFAIVLVAHAGDCSRSTSTAATRSRSRRCLPVHRARAGADRCRPLQRRRPLRAAQLGARRRRSRQRGAARGSRRRQARSMKRRARSSLAATVATRGAVDGRQARTAPAAHRPATMPGV